METKPATVEVLMNVPTRAAMLGRVSLYVVLSAVQENVVQVGVDSRLMVHSVEEQVGSVTLLSIAVEILVNVLLMNTNLTAFHATIIKVTAILVIVLLMMINAELHLVSYQCSNVTNT